MDLVYKITNVGLRLSNIGLRFLLTIFIAKYFAIDELGVYGLIIAGVSFAIYPLGLEFYTYSSRDLINRKREDWGDKLYTQSIFHLCLYVIFLPIFYYIFLQTSLKIVVVYVLVLVILEHINQELFRVHIVVQDQIIASLNVFIRQGIWVVILIPFLFFNEDLRNIQSLLIFWILGELLALFFSLYWLANKSKLKILKNFNSIWLKGAFRTIIPLFIATIFLRALGTLDRFVFEYFADGAQLSAYVFYISLASLVFTINDSGVFSFRYPVLLKAYKTSNAVYTKAVNVTVKQVLICSCLSTLFLYFIVDYIIVWIDNSALLEYSNMFVLLLVAKNIQVFSMIPHYCLYAKKLDNSIMNASIIGLSSFVLAIAVLYKQETVLSIPLALCIGYFMTFLSKMKSLRRTC